MSKNKTFTGVRTLKKHKETYVSENNTTEEMLNIINSENSQYKSKKQHQPSHNMMQQSSMQQSSMQHSPMQQSSMQQSLMQPSLMQPNMMQQGSMQQGSMQQGSMQPNIMGQQQMNTNDYDPSMVNMFMPLNAQQQNNPYLSDVNMQMPQISEHMSMSEQMPMLGIPQQQMMAPQQQMMAPQQQMMAPQQQMMTPQMMPQQQMMLSDHYSMSEGMPQSNLANLANL
jgi:hypothetical protein